MSLADRDALSALRGAVGRADRDELFSRFYTCWFALDPSVRDMFPPGMRAHRETFARALDWVLGELIAQRSEGLVAFLAQLGRDHRKYGVTPEHYEVMAHSLFATLCADQIDRWTDELDAAARQVINLVTGVMRGAAEAEPGPAWWTGTVDDCWRASRDVAVVRLYLDRPMDYLPGQYVSVEVPQCPRNWRYLSPAIPAHPDGGVEFHIRAVPGGLVSGAVVDETRPGDRWRISSPHGALQVDRCAGDVLMVAGNTGLAPLRAIIMDMCRFADNPRVHLFYGARFPYELYDLRPLWQLASTNPWLSVTPVSEYATDPPWAADYPDVQPPRGLHVRQKGRLPEVVAGYGGWGDRQILISGSPGMVCATRGALISSGASPERIQHDPIAAGT